MTNKPKLFLHMGAHRTATTTIQAFMFENREALLKQGILYPFDVSRHREEILAATELGQMGKFVSRLKAEMDRHSGVNTLVVSDEDIGFIRELNIFAPLREMFDLHFVLFMRRQDLWLESWYLQHVKWQFSKRYCNLTFTEFFKQRADFFWVDYGLTIGKLEQIVDPANIHLAVFEKAAMGEGPVEEFMRLVGIAADRALVKPESKNASLSPLMTEFVRNLPLHKARAPFRAFIERSCAKVDQAMHPAKVSALYMDHAQRSAYLAEFAESNRSVAQRYFGRDVLFQEPLPAPDAPLANLTLPADSKTLLEQFVAPMIDKLIMVHRTAEAEAAKKAKAKR